MKPITIKITKKPPRNPLHHPTMIKKFKPQVFSDSRQEDLAILEQQEALQELSNDNDLEDPKETETIYEE